MWRNERMRGVQSRNCRRNGTRELDDSLSAGCNKMVVEREYFKLMYPTNAAELISDDKEIIEEYNRQMDLEGHERDDLVGHPQLIKGLPAQIWEGDEKMRPPNHVRD